MKDRFDKPVSSWIKFGVWATIYILFIIWVGNYWWLLLLPFIFDVFITKFIPWTFWQKTKNKTLYKIFSWIDAVVFALIAVYFLNLYLFQNYKIPSSSLEKTLLVGDFLLVSKASYGPRIPNTPLSAPLVQHTFPWGGKSYIENPQWEYRRLKGLTTVKRGDIVVFNFPTGDTVPERIANPDYYTLVFNEGVQALVNQGVSPYDIFARASFFRSKIEQLGRDRLYSNKDIYGDIVWRPVDRRENYVKRCVGLPGDKFQIIDNQIYIDDEPLEDRAGIQYNYYLQTDGTALTQEFFDKLEISRDDIHLAQYLPENDTNLMQKFDLTREIWDLPMTKEVFQKVKGLSYVKVLARKPAYQFDRVFPLYADYGWNRDNFGPVVIPHKSATVQLNLSNLPLYEQIIRNYERNSLEVRDEKIFINGVEADSYTFKMDYYFMMGDNRHNSADSRYWGFVPEDHIVGRPLFIWLSLDKDKGWFSGKIRFSRIGKSGKQ